MKKDDVIRQKYVNTTFYLTGILAHKVNNQCKILFTQDNSYNRAGTLKTAL